MPNFTQTLGALLFVEFSTDISTRLRKDFAANSEQASNLIIEARATENFPKSERIIRCLIFVANGSISELNSAIDLAKTDWRDLIMAAEYELGTRVQIRDFNSPFAAD